ncbi:MAG TPA: S9 family peptidase [Steroidobacteraceae bacterium]|nr:S9 family peptidase [Steroidobacteraceae bacterium]
MKKKNAGLFRAGSMLAALLPVLALAAAPPPSRVEQGALILDGLPPRSEADAEKVGNWLESRQASFVDWLADGSLLISTRFGDAEQLHRVKGALGTREQLTYFRDPVRAATADPYNGNRFVFMKDQGGDENSQLYLRELTDNSTRLLTDGKSLQGKPVYANDGKRIAFHSNARDGASYDIYVVDTTAVAPPRLVLGGGDQAYYVLDWSLDDQKLLILRYVSINDSTLFIADVATGKLTAVEPDEKSKVRMAVDAARFSRDGRGIYYVSDHGGEFRELRYTDMFTFETRSVAPQSHWDVESFDLSRDGHYLAYTLNEGGTSRLVVHDLLEKADLVLPPLPAGSIVSSLGFDPTGKRLALSIESAQSPRDVYVLTADNRQLARWTQSELGPIDGTRLVAAELVRFPTWDRNGADYRQLPAFVYRPKTPGVHPVVINIHGGPESQFRPGWDAFTQYLVNELGYIVVAPNVRGSSGYGRSFLGLDDGKLREDSVRDIGSLLVWIGLQPDIDRSKVVVMGGSYGGYMTLASLVNYSDRLAGGVDVVGISNFVNFLEKTSAYRRDLRRAEYGDERDPAMRAFLQRISPLTNAASIRRPLLIVQGMNDPRVPAAESEQMVARLRGGGGEVWYLAAKDEGHGFRKKANRDVYLETVSVFLRRLAGNPP